MATRLHPESVLLLLLLLIASSAGGALNSTEVSSALESLREHGYTLFPNAVTTSDLQHDLLSPAAAAFTVFAPKDDMLFALDMATDAAVYVNTLRYHFIPNHRLSSADLRNLSSPFLDTLLPHFALLVGTLQNDDVFSLGPTLMVDGVRLSNPDIFLGSALAVHGIDGILIGGLNVTRDSDPPANRSDVLPTVESPAPVNIPVEEMFRFDWNNPPPAPTSDRDYIPASQKFDWPVDVESPPEIERLKNLGKIKRHRKGGRRRRHHRRQADRLPNEL